MYTIVLRVPNYSMLHLHISIIIIYLVLLQNLPSFVTIFKRLLSTKTDYQFTEKWTLKTAHIIIYIISIVFHFITII